MLNSEEINNFYREKLSAHGASAKGVGWKDDQAQRVRLQQLMNVIDTRDEFSLNDLGCGTGEVIHLLDELFPKQYDYAGYDILDEMIVSARNRFKEGESIHFFKFEKYDQLRTSDYTISSGIFNVRDSIPDDQWQAFILETIRAMANCSRKGFAFNALTKYSDEEYMRPDLYYSDPLFLFDYCKKNFSRNVALLHDYEIYDFTIIVRK
jgi:SAM-dependent methyltransferase